MSRHDLVVLGGGTAGIVAALSARTAGARVALVERDRTGGDCLWTGCVPSKALLAAARRAHDMRTADRVGLTPRQPDVDLARVMKHVRDAQGAIAPTDSPDRLRREGIEVLQTGGRFTGPGRIATDDGRELVFRRALIATGAEPTRPSAPGMDDPDVLTTDTVWELSELPERLLIVGGGPVGCELGQAFQRLGSHVTLVEMADGLLPAEDPDAGRLIADRLRDEGATVHPETVVERLERREGGWSAVLGASGSGAAPPVAADRVLVATGRRPTTEGLGLDRAGVATTDHGAVVVDERLRTANPRVYAAGDVVGRLPFTHVAATEGATAVANALFGLRRGVDHDTIPRVTYTDPTVASVGLTAGQARVRHGEEARVRRVDLADVDRAVVSARTDGFGKLVAGPRGRLVGACVVSPHAGDVITTLAGHLRHGASLSDIGQVVHPYPTFGEVAGHAGAAALRERVTSPPVRTVTRSVLWLARQLDRFRHH